MFLPEVNEVQLLQRHILTDQRLKHHTCGAGAPAHCFAISAHRGYDKKFRDQSLYISISF